MRVNNKFSTVNQDMHILVTLDYSKNLVFETFTNAELTLPQNVCKFQRTQFIIMLAMFISKPQFGGFLLFGLPSIFFPLHNTDKCPAEIPIFYQDHAQSVDSLTPHSFEHASYNLWEWHI